MHAKSFSDSVKFACRGIQLIARSERNFRTHLILAGLAIAVGLLLHFSWIKWVVLTMGIAFMLVVEMLNTAIEFLVDWQADGTYSTQAAQVKDMAAGACLTTALAMVVVGVFLLWG